MDATSPVVLIVGSGRGNLSFPLTYTPRIIHPYLQLMRLDKPVGILFIFWPFAWGLTFAAHQVRMDLTGYAIELAKVFLIAVLTRSYGCTINDVCDYEYDRNVERCKSRPLPSGKISYRSACIFAFGQLLLCLAVSYSLLSRSGFLASAVQLIPLTSGYPLLKRVTYWPQAWLGIATGQGAVISWVSVIDGPSADHRTLFFLLLSIWSWTMFYDTIYACQDRSDDIKAGVCSTAILFGSWIRPILTSFGLLFIISLGYAGVVNKQTFAFFTITIGGTAIHLIWQYVTVDLNDPQSCKKNFVGNSQLGWIIVGGLLADLMLDRM